jgi:hypothetical protein
MFAVVGYVVITIVIVVWAVRDPSEGGPMLVFHLGYGALSVFLGWRVHVSRRRELQQATVDP